MCRGRLEDLFLCTKVIWFYSLGWICISAPIYKTGPIRTVCNWGQLPSSLFVNPMIPFVWMYIYAYMLHVCFGWWMDVASITLSICQPGPNESKTMQSFVVPQVACLQMSHMVIWCIYRKLYGINNFRFGLCSKKIELPIPLSWTFLH